MVYRPVNQFRSKIETGFSDISDSFESWWMPATTVVVAFLVLSVGMNTIPALSDMLALYAGYRAYGKSVPSQALGTGFYFLAILFGLAAQPSPFIGYLFLGFAVKRYAFWRHPDEAFRRPISGAEGCYYNPRKVGLGKRLMINIALWGLGFKIPIVKKVPDKLVKKPLIILAGLEIEASELEDGDILYYLHQDSSGYIFESDDESEIASKELPDVTFETNY